MGDEPEVGSVKPKPTKAAHGSQIRWESGSEDEEVTSTHGAGAKTGLNPSHPKLWYIPGLQFPYEVTACTQFYALCPKERCKKI